MDTATGSGLMEEFELMKQAKYRVYMQNIDKALKNFEYSSEWADLISALGKLNKVSQFFNYDFAIERKSGTVKRRRTRIQNSESKPPTRSIDVNTAFANHFNYHT